MLKNKFISILLITIIINFITYYYLQSFLNVKNPEYVFSDQVNVVPEEQVKITNHLKNQIIDGDHTFDNPLVVVDPYNQNPYSALIIFKTDQISKVIVSIKDKNSDYNVQYSDYKHGFTNVHAIPIYGLSSNHSNIVKLRLVNKFGIPKEKEIEIVTEDVNNKSLDIIENKKQALEEKFIVASNRNGFQFYDLNGYIRGEIDPFYDASPFVQLSSNKLIYYRTYDGQKIVCIDYLGQIINVISAEESKEDFRLISKQKLISKSLDDNSFYLYNLSNSTNEEISLQGYLDNEEIIESFDYDNSTDSIAFLTNDNKLYKYYMESKSINLIYEFDYEVEKLAVGSDLKHIWNNKEVIEYAVFNKEKKEIEIFHFLKGEKYQSHTINMNSTNYSFEKYKHMLITSIDEFKVIRSNDEVVLSGKFNNTIYKTDIQFISFK